LELAKNGLAAMKPCDYVDVGIKSSYLMLGHHKEIWAPAVLSLFAIAHLIRLLNKPSGPVEPPERVPKRLKTRSSCLNTGKRAWRFCRGNEVASVVNEWLLPTMTSVRAWWRQPPSYPARSSGRKFSRAKRGNMLLRHRMVRRAKSKFGVRRDGTWDMYEDARQECPFEDARQFKRGMYFDSKQMIDDEDFVDARPFVDMSDGNRVGVIHGMPAVKSRTIPRQQGHYDSDSSILDSR